MLSTGNQAESDESLATEEDSTMSAAYASPRKQRRVKAVRMYAATMAHPTLYKHISRISALTITTYWQGCYLQYKIPNSLREHSNVLYAPIVSTNSGWRVINEHRNHLNVKKTCSTLWNKVYVL